MLRNIDTIRKIHEVRETECEHCGQIKELAYSKENELVKFLSEVVITMLVDQ